jgi:hypothetical protein
VRTERDLDRGAGAVRRARHRRHETKRTLQRRFTSRHHLQEKLMHPGTTSASADR